jgi:hypothetical protein
MAAFLAVPSSWIPAKAAANALLHAAGAYLHRFRAFEIKAVVAKKHYKRYFYRPCLAKHKRSACCGVF